MGRKVARGVAFLSLRVFESQRERDGRQEV